MKEYNWYKGQEVAVVSRNGIPYKALVTQVFFRGGKLTSAKVGTALYSPSGHKKGSSIWGDNSIEPWDKKHEEEIERYGLVRDAERLAKEAPLEVLRVFVAACKRGKKDG